MQRERPLLRSAIASCPAIVGAFIALLSISSTASGTESLAVEKAVQLEHGSCLLFLPAGLTDGDKAPLIVCLHGTNTRAPDLMAYWRSMTFRLPCVIISPQGVAAGWRETDMPLIREVINDLIPTLPIDPERVLLTGHSAGGAMALHLAYCEGFPCTAVAVTANYVPPSVKPENVRKRLHLPVLYAVGQRDTNRPRMIEGLEILRKSGASVKVLRPDIGHVLDRSVGGQALRWFEDLCREGVEQCLVSSSDSSDRSMSNGERMAALEAIIATERTHFADQIPKARKVLAELRAPAEKKLAWARRLIGEGDLLRARDVLLEIERTCRPGSIQIEARELRLAVESDEAVAGELNRKTELEMIERSERLWNEVEAALRNSDLADARRKCTKLIALCPGSVRAAEARDVIEKIDKINPR